uniref:Uncharacterized protein n=1 Tax=Panagrolaimus davidi TaxID=227884 RepID=A0A914Q4W2_9BILA
MNPKQQHEELNVFIDRFEKTAKQATAGLEEPVVKQKMLEEFLLKLDSDLAFYVRDKEPADYETAVEHARKIDVLLKLKKMRATENENDKMNDLEELADRLAERMRLYGPGRNPQNSNGW